MSILFFFGGLPAHPQNPHSWRTAEMRFLRSVKGYTRLNKIRSEVIGKELTISGIQTKLDQSP
jgi:hypothetical protein